MRANSRLGAYSNKYGSLRLRLLARLTKVRLYFGCTNVFTNNIFICLQEFYEEEMESGEDTDGEKIKKSDVNVVRNYVVLRTLQEALTQFDTDLGKLSE